ncbi:MAG: hypothetical protein KA765_08265, partial [Thermoflexales bacterium]|nr:hypothetical protein [Thermoflexales bacterium]
PAVIPAGNPGVGYKVWTDWTPFVLQPDTVYHWRLRFVGSNSQTYYGPDQTFRTLPDGRVTVGNGATASCTDAALSSALATAKEIRFDCGVLPITLTLSAKTINTNVTINGENKVTLNMANAGRHFTIQSGATLTLTQIALINGRATCGGAVNVAANAKVVLNEARLISNYSYAQGGAVCVNGTASIANTVFMSNTAVSHGGAIGNYGTTTINSSRFTGNNAGVNGGGIDMGGHVAVTNTTFSHNVGLRGGGINTYGGVLTVVGSSFISNTANWYGGGLSNDASVTTVSGSTFSDNVAKVMGGGLETSGVGTLTIVNSTISANRAITEGGGVYWYPGVSTGPITLLNSTLANNTAGVQGGNIYAGGSANATIMLKNTLLTQGTPNNCDAAISSQGNNLDSANSCGLGASGDKVNTNPKLGALQNNGGSTLTHALLAGSPAIDAGTNNGCPATDQRGTARPIDGDLNSSAICDIGAYEAPSSRSVYLPLIRR